MAEQEDICLLQFLKNERHVSENYLDMMRMERVCIQSILNVYKSIHVIS